MAQVPPEVSIEMRPVLTGGFLKRPVVLDTKLVDDKHFALVVKESHPVSYFLTGRAYTKRVLKHATLLPDLVRLRNAASKNPVDEQARDDKAALLGLDKAASARKVKRRRVQGSASASVLPGDGEKHPDGDAVVQIEVPLSDGTKWEVNVLSSGSKEPLYIEFTVENMEILFREVRQQLDDAGVFPKADGSDSDGEGSNVEEAQGSPSSAPSSAVARPVPISGRKGLRWLETRSCWDLRYEHGGKLRCKTFSVPKDMDGDEFETMKEAKRMAAVAFLAGVDDP